MVFGGHVEALVLDIRFHCKTFVSPIRTFNCMCVKMNQSHREIQGYKMVFAVHVEA